MSNRGYVAALALILSGLTFALIAGHGPWAGREFLEVSPTHGVNTGDVPVLAAWLLGMACCWRLWRR